MIGHSRECTVDERLAQAEETSTAERASANVASFPFRPSPWARQVELVLLLLYFLLSAYSERGRTSSSSSSSAGGSGRPEQRVAVHPKERGPASSPDLTASTSGSAS